MVNGADHLSGTGRELLERPEVARPISKAGAHDGAMMDSSLPHLLYEEGSFGVFLLVTVVLGGGAAWLSGRAIAADLAAVVARRRLYADPRRRPCASSISPCSRARCCRPHYYLVDTAVCLLFGFLGFRVTRAGQMARAIWLVCTARRAL